MEVSQGFLVVLAIVYVVFWVGVVALGAYVLYLLIKALRKYVNSTEVRSEKKEMCQSLGEALKAERMRCQMTQEFVADALGVSRQAVSKWENGNMDPSTSNLLALAKLYDIDAQTLLKSVAPKGADGQDA